MPAEVRLCDIGKRFGAPWAVRHVNLDIGRSGFFTFLGPSGCGKTTLLRMIAGFVVPDEGAIFLDGERVNDLPPWRRDVGMVFQNYALWPHMSVFDNVAFGLRERNIARGEIVQRVTEALRQVDLNGMEKRRPSQLSGGQQQRVALARTLVIRPRVLLLDEPLSNLDAKLRVEMRLELLKLQRDIGITTIYVTPDQEEALAMSTRIAVMDQGRVVQEGAPREIYERPASEFVAAFVGKANLFTAAVVRVTAGFIEVKTENGLSLRVAGASRAAGLSHGELLSVRPEAVELGSSAAGWSNENIITGQVMAAAYQGSMVEYEIGIGNQSIRTRAVNPKGKPIFQRGQQVAMRFAPEDVVIIGET
jgi:spermidine/putrescine ABC transporter ATP-binding subunit